MTNNKLDNAIATLINASGMPGLRLRPRTVARHFGVSLRQAQLACRRAARRGLLAVGRTA
jgi:hypothetical protein